MYGLVYEAVLLTVQIQRLNSKSITETIRIPSFAVLDAILQPSTSIHLEMKRTVVKGVFRAGTICAHLFRMMTSTRRAPRTVHFCQ